MCWPCSPWPGLGGEEAGAAFPLRCRRVARCNAMVDPVNRTTLAGTSTAEPKPLKLAVIELQPFAALGEASAGVPGLIAAGSVREAVVAAKSAVAAEGGNFIHWYRYGVALAHAGRLAEAEAAFLR